MCEKQNRRRKTGHNTSASLEEKFLASCQNSEGTIAVQRNEWEDEEEAPRAASCASASLQRVKESKWQQQTRSEGRSVSQEDGKHPEDYREGKRKHKKENSAVLRNVWRQKAMVPGKVRTHCFIVRLARRREGLGEQRLADFTILPHGVRWRFRA